MVKTSTNDYFYLVGSTGYAKGIAELDKISKLYGQGKYADQSKTRSVNVEDINKVTGYDPRKEGNKEGNPFGQYQPYEYGNRVEYKIEDNKVKYKENSESDWKDSSYDTFQYPKEDGTTEDLKEGETKAFESTYYKYYPESLSESFSDASVGSVKNNSKEYKALFLSNSYWLGSQFVQTFGKRFAFGMRAVSSSGQVIGYIQGYAGSGLIGSVNYCVRPAVFLQSGIKLTGSSESGWELSE